MVNCREEFLEHVKDKSIECAIIQTGSRYVQEDMETRVLKVGFKEDEYDLFLGSLDFEYDGGFGGQELYGNIWYTGGLWSERGEYDGSEWWEYKECPTIPKELTIY